MRLVDLSNPIENTDFADPPGFGPKVEYFGHDATADQMLAFFPGIARAQLPGGEGWAIERVTLSTHNGTHLDAPYHYHSTMDGGKRSITIDEVPLEWCFGRGVKLDFRHLADGHVVTGEEMAAAFDPIPHEPAAADIVLVDTWTHGLFVVGQAPFALGNIANLPTMRGKRAACFLTFALNAGTSIDKLTTAVGQTGADVVGGLETKRNSLDEPPDLFVERLLGVVEPA